MHYSMRTSALWRRDRFLPARRALEIADSFDAPTRRGSNAGTVAVLGLLAIAVCWPLRARASDPNHDSQTLTVEARDLITNVPVPDVSLKLSVGGDTELRATTSANGIARFAYTLPEATSRRFFSVTARGEDLVPLAARWTDEPSSPTPPSHLLFQTEKATTIGGRVLDEEGQPLADAAVVVSVNKSYPKSDQWVNVQDESTRTGADGRWSLNNVPERPDSIEIGAYHHLCLTDHSAFFLESFRPLSALRDGSAVLRLRHGTPIKGIVLSPDGKPVAGAEVYYGEGWDLANAIPPVNTDAQGRFTMGIQPGTDSTLTARAANFGPTLQPLKVGKEPQRVCLTLPPAHSVRGRVVDAGGKPIAGAWIQVFWSGAEGAVNSAFGSAIALDLSTDDDGRFEWREAPARGVHLNVSAEGFAGKENVPVASDVDHEIVLKPPTTIRGTVVDGMTGQPLPEFSITMAAAWEPGDPLIWQRGEPLDEKARKSPGMFEYTTATPAHQYLFRVQADGYLPEDCEPLAPDGTVHALRFRLTRAEPIRGTVRNPDGSPARDSFVYLVPAHRDGWIEYLRLLNDEVSEEDRSNTIHAKVAADGRFSLPPQRGNFALLALADAGFALVPRRALHGDDVLRLQPWARVSGTVTIEGKPAANLVLQSYDPEGSAPMEGKPRLVRQCHVKTNADGRFELPRVMPGRLALVQWVPNGVKGRIWALARATLDVQSGRSYDLKIGTNGRLVTGRLVLPRTETWMIRKAEIVPKDAKTDRPITIGVEILEAGHFRALDLRPGDYSLHIALHEPPPADSCGWGRLLSAYDREFTVPEGNTANEPPLDLGLLEPIKVDRRPLQVGDRAPDFTIQTLGGPDLKLADYRGKYVLLDFWASWCAPCLDEMPNLQAIHDQFANDPRFVLVSVSLDDRPRDAAAMVKALKLPWLQGFAGPDSPVASAYGATAIPATFLIGPDGKVLAKDLRGEKTKTAVAEALKP